MDDPIDHIEWRDAVDLHPNSHNPNRVFKQELRLLEFNILTTGWVQPLLITPSQMIIDGFHRWRLAQDSKSMVERWAGRVPVTVIDVQDDEGMALTVRMNRAKGTHIATEMHLVVADLVTNWQWTRERVAQEIGASLQEVDLLCQEGVFTARGIKEWAWSPAWYPAEDRSTPRDDALTYDEAKSMIAGDEVTG